MLFLVSSSFTSPPKLIAFVIGTRVTPNVDPQLFPQFSKV
ncbi:hypothetical protein Lser_V15G31908 [Lactuca serriola]